jgi:hypothetical protein
VLIAGGVTAFLLTSGDDKKKNADPTPTNVATNTAGFPSSGAVPSDTTVSEPTDTSAPTDTSSGSGGDISESDARQVVEQYLNDINDQDRTDAQTLICPPLVASWKSAIDKPGGDFTVEVTDKTFKNSDSTSDGLEVTYNLHVKAVESGQTGASDATFVVVDQDGLKICGEK